MVLHATLTAVLERLNPTINSIVSLVYPLDQRNVKPIERATIRYAAMMTQDSKPIVNDLLSPFKEHVTTCYDVIVTQDSKPTVNVLLAS